MSLPQRLMKIPSQILKLCFAFVNIFAMLSFIGGALFLFYLAGSIVLDMK